ncbi:MAG: hypothetical protein JNK83_03835 [Rhizobiales bacterium]|nr:hypothetical protein [Hyphomicrobiales bacterium]
MKNILLSSSVLAILAVAGPACAADVESVQGLIVSGKLTGYVGFAEVSDPDDEFDDDSYMIFGGSGVLSIPLGDSFSVQADILAEENDVNNSTEGAVDAFGYGGHLSWRNPDMGLIGVFAGQGEGNHPGDSDDQDVWWVGLEAQYYIDATTLYGQVGWTESDSTHDSIDYESFFARGAVRYFIRDNMMLQGELQYTEGNVHGDPLDVIGWGLKAEYGLESMPFSLMAEYRGTHGSVDGENATEHAGLVGFSFALGASSLREQDRYGATLETPSFLLRAAEWSSLMD